jgi:hypothetical protein
VPCPGGCAAHFPSYLSNGTLTYVTEQLLPSGTGTITLVSWAGGHLRWQSTIWRKSGGQPDRIRTLPPVTQSPPGHQVTDIAW